MSSRKGYPIVGGPANGGFAKEADFQQPFTVKYWHHAPGYNEGDMHPGGFYGQYADEYVGLNRASSASGIPTRVWLHKDILRAAGVNVP